jgi:hypothetical protein
MDLNPEKGRLILPGLRSSGKHVSNAKMQGLVNGKC